MKKLTLKDFQERLNTIHSNEHLKAISWDGGTREAEVICLDCRTHYVKIGNNFLDKRKTSICKKCYPTQPNILKDDWMPPEGYSQVGEYQGMHHKLLIRHDACGFIWEITPTNLKLGKGCPKCNRKVSKGEQQIIAYLKDHNIEYIFQYPLQIDGHKLSIDFYLPAYDLYIEYNGEQHYEPVEYFGGEEKLYRQKLNDNLKQEYLKEKLLIIPCWEFNNIDSILESSTTIPQGST